MHSRLRNLLIISVLVLVSAAASASFAEATTMRAKAVIEQALFDASGWSAVHAVEAAMATGTDFDFNTALSRIESDVKDVPGLRVGVWRIKAHRSPAAENRQACVAALRSILHDRAATDRLYALETLAKLGEAELPEDQAAVEAVLEEVGEASMPFVLWYRSDSQSDAVTEALIRLLESESELTRLRAAYVLCRRNRLNERQWASMMAIVRTHPECTLAEGFELASAYVLATSPHDAVQVRRSMLRNIEAYPASAQAEIARSLGVRSDTADLLVLAGWLDHDRAAVRLAAAESLLLMQQLDHQHATDEPSTVTDEDNPR